MGGFGRRNKSKNQPVDNRRNSIAERQAQPTFSYYANRMPSETVRLRSEQTIVGVGVKGPKNQETSLISRVFTWLTLVATLLVLIKVLTLEPNARVIVTGDKSNLSSEVIASYQKAANDLLDNNLLNRSKLTLDTSGVAKNLQAQFPELENVVVTVPLIGARPIVYVLPVKALIGVDTNRGLFSLGGNGRIIAKMQPGANGDVVLHDLSGITPEIGQSYIPASTMKFIETVRSQFASAKMPLESLTLPRTSPFEIDAKLQGKGGIIKFNLEEDPLQQSGAALAVIRKLNGMPPTYIDVRVPERAYYK